MVRFTCSALPWRASQQNFSNRSTAYVAQRHQRRYAKQLDVAIRAAAVDIKGMHNDDMLVIDLVGGFVIDEHRTRKLVFAVA